MSNPDKEIWVYKDIRHYEQVMSRPPVHCASEHYYHASMVKALEERVEGLERNNQILMRNALPANHWAAPDEPIDAMRIAFFDALRNAFESKEVPATMPWIEAYKAMRQAYLASRGKV
jgi:hypothetical protein